MPIDYTSTGVASIFLTAALRLFDYILKKRTGKSSTEPVSNALLETRLQKIDRYLSNEHDRRIREDILYRVEILETEARRRGWNLIREREAPQ